MKKPFFVIKVLFVHQLMH